MNAWQTAAINRFTTPVREAVVIALAACLFGFGYSALTGKGVFGAGVSTQTRTPVTPERAPRFITYEEARSYYTSGRCLFVDARHEYDYKLGHIQGAINIPLKDFDERRSPPANISKDTPLVVYCDGVECNSSTDLGTRLAAAGFAHVNVFFGGWSEWQAHNMPVGR